MVLYDSLGSGPQVVTVAAGTLGEQAAARLRLRNRGETPAPAALWASRVAGLAGFREPLCSPLPPRCWDLQVSCALFQDPLYPLSAWPQLHSFLGERAGCPRAVGVCASFWAPAPTPTPPSVLILGHSAVFVEEGESPLPFARFSESRQQKVGNRQLQTLRYQCPRHRWIGRREDLGRAEL